MMYFKDAGKINKFVNSKLYGICSGEVMINYRISAKTHCRTAMRSACLCRYAYMWLPFTTKPYGLFPYHIAALSPVISTETITSLSAVNDQLNIATLDNTLVDARLKLGNGAEDHIVFCSGRGKCRIRWWAWRMWS